MVASGNIRHYLQGKQLILLPVYVPMHYVPFEKGSTSKGKGKHHSKKLWPRKGAGHAHRKTDSPEV